MNHLYIVDPANFTGNVLNTMPFVEKGAKHGIDILNSTYVHYCEGMTFEQYNQKHGGNLLALTWDEFNTQFYSNHLTSLCKPFAEVTEEAFTEALERFAKSIHRAIDTIYFSKRVTEPFEDQKEIYVKSNSKFYKLSYQDIYFVEALADYVLVYTENTRYIVYSTMKAIEEKLKGTTFVRVHRSYIINLRKIQFIEGNTLIINGKYIPISKTYQEALFQKLNFL